MVYPLGALRGVDRRGGEESADQPWDRVQHTRSREGGEEGALQLAQLPGASPSQRQEKQAGSEFPQSSPWR